LNRTNKIILAFVLATLAGFFAISGGYLIFAISTDYFDREGSTGMAVIFMLAPIGGLALGAVAAFVTSRLVKPAIPAASLAPAPDR
jgi:hypothetical protein